jgi:hypothetical protein
MQIWGLCDAVTEFNVTVGVMHRNVELNCHHCVQNGSGAHPASYPMGTRGYFPGVKRPGREADHSPPPNAEVKE